MRTNTLLVMLLAATIILISACSMRPTSKPDQQPRTSYEEAVAPTDASHYTLKQGETAVRPVLDKQVAPVYPPSLVRPDAAPVTVVAELVMDENGKVQAVHPKSDTDEESGGALFEAAVVQAAMQWTFTPFWVQNARPDGTYQRTQLPFSLWYTFQFRMIDGKPSVEMDKRPPGM